jgi:hypothetical protein
MIYFSSKIKYVPAKTTTDNTSPINIAMPPSDGVGSVCDVRQFGLFKRPFAIEICTIDGIVKPVMQNAIKKPNMINIQKGIDSDEMFKGI